MRKTKTKASRYPERCAGKSVGQEVVDLGRDGARRDDVGDAEERRGQDLEEGQHVGAQHGAGEAAEAADDRGDEGLQDRREAHVRVDLAGLGGVEEARDGGQRRGDGEAPRPPRSRCGCP